MNFTFNNHLTYTIGGREYGTRQTPYEKFIANVGKIDLNYYAGSNWLQEQHRTADLVYNDLGKDAVVMFSGGTDSEIVLRAFIGIGITPRAVFIKFKHDYNIPEFYMAERIAAELNIKLDVFDLDIIDFYESGAARDLASSYQCSQLAYLAAYHCILKYQAPAILGGEIFLQRYTSPTYAKWFYSLREEQDCSAMRLGLQTGIPIVNQWFSYTPEMIGYFITHPDIVSLVSNRFNYKLTSASSKNAVLCNLMNTVIPKQKRTGFEKLRGFNHEAFNALRNCYLPKLEHSLDGIFMDELHSQLFGNTYVGC